MAAKKKTAAQRTRDNERRRQRTAEKAEAKRREENAALGLAQGDPDGGEQLPGGMGPVPPEAQDEAQAAQKGPHDPAEAILESHAAQPTELAREERISEETAAAVAEPLAEIAEFPPRPGRPMQDQANFFASRQEEAVAQGVEKTTQERMWEISRAEELAGKGMVDPPVPLEDADTMPSVAEDTAGSMFSLSRAEEVRQGKREEALFDRGGIGVGANADAIDSMNPELGRTDVGEDVPPAEEIDEERVEA